MPSLIATLKVKEDKVEEAQAFLKELAAEVRASEPGTLAYVIHQQQDDPRTFVVYEKYESDEALATHGANLRAKGGAFAAILDGRPAISRLREI